MLTTQHYSRNTVLNLIHIPAASKTHKLSLSLLKPIQMARSLLMLKKEIQMGTNSKGPPKASCLDTVSPGDGQIFPSGAPPHTRARLHVPPITAKHAPLPLKLTSVASTKYQQTTRKQTIFALMNMNRNFAGAGPPAASWQEHWPLFDHPI